MNVAMSGEERTTILNVQGLHAGYGKIPMLLDVSLTIRKSECVGLWGHNGMGKSTLMRTLMGYLPATAGTIIAGKNDLTRKPVQARAAAGIGYVPQGREIFPALSVMDNLLMGCALRKDDSALRVEEVLVDFPRLKPLLGRVGGLLSGGEQQLLALARCLCGAPALLLLDEPTEGIQPSIIEEIGETLAALRSTGNMTILLVEQNQAFIAGLADRVLLMQRGRVSQELDPAELEAGIGIG